MMHTIPAGMAVMLVPVALIIAVFAVGIGWLVRLGTTPAKARQPASLESADRNTPVEILRRRYAAGEIDEDEYLIRLSGLSQY